jgi:hypothetical protein
VETVTTDIVLFIDSDCVAHPDVVERVEGAFASDPEVVSITGSYDDTPPEQNFASLYMNLRHHFVHQRAKTDGATFWAGCGAVRTSVFREVGGFDAEQFPAPMIEDIELGVRLRKRGRTLLDPALQVKHLKHWTLETVIRADILHRAVPWGRLILATGEMPNDLNLAWKQRVAAALAPFALGGAAVFPLAALAAPALALAALAPVGASVALGWPMSEFFWKKRGPSFAARAWAFHQVHLTYSAVTMAVLVADHAVRARRST